MGEATYPNLGFNPVPGVPENVAAMGAKVSTAVDSLGEANGLLGQLRDSGGAVWRGAAGDAFRAHVNEKLVTDLTHAHASLDKAVGLLRGWHTDLVSFKDRAAGLDREAGDAKQRLASAQADLRAAQSNPDLNLAGQHFPDQASLAKAQALLDTAESTLRSAGARVEDADGALQAILRRAKELGAEHEQVARRVADELKHATDHLAPHKPGMFSRLAHDFTSAMGAVGSWVKNHLDAIHSVLTTISAIGGLVALVTPPPIDAIALGVSVAAGLGAMGVDAANPKFRNGINQLVHGHFNKDSLGAAFTGATDLLSVVPGVSAATKLARGTEVAAGAAADMPRIVQVASSVAKSPGIPVKLIARIPKVTDALVATKMVKETEAASTDVVHMAINKLWRGRSVGSDLYHDVKHAVG